MPKPRFLNVEGHPELVRDSSSGAVLNTSNETLGTAAKKRKRKDDEINTLKDDVDVLKSDVTEIKSLLKSLLETLK